MERRVNVRKFAALALIACLAVWGCSGASNQKSDEAVYNHVLESDETLETVARHYYLDPTQAVRIADFNHIENEGLRPGMTLRIPMSPDEIERLKVREEARVPYNQGLALAENGAYIDAVERFKAALKIDDSFADAYYNTGVSLQMMKSFDKATSNFKKAIKQEPGNPEYEFALGNCYFHQESYGAAATAFEKTIGLDDAHLKAHYSLAVCYEKLSRPEDARRTWQRYLELDSKSVWASEARKHLEKLE